MMMTSRYLEQILFKEQSPAADQLFEERSERLFQTKADNSFVEIHIQEPPPTDLGIKASVEINGADFDQDLYGVEGIHKYA